MTWEFVLRKFALTNKCTCLTFSQNLLNNYAYTTLPAFILHTYFERNELKLHHTARHMYTKFKEEQQIIDEEHKYTLTYFGGMGNTRARLHGRIFRHVT
jgi:hypothetical protein